MKLCNLLRLKSLITKHNMHPCFRVGSKGGNNRTYGWDAFDGPLGTLSLWTLSSSSGLLVSVLCQASTGMGLAAPARDLIFTSQESRRTKCSLAVGTRVFELWVVNGYIFQDCYGLIFPDCDLLPGIPFHYLLQLVIFKLNNFNVLILDMIIEQMLALLPQPPLPPIQLQDILVMQSRYSSFVNTAEMLWPSLGPRISIHRLNELMYLKNLDLCLAHC